MGTALTNVKNDDSPWKGHIIGGAYQDCICRSYMKNAPKMSTTNSLYYVILGDPASVKSPVRDSVHVTREQAEARCREIMFQWLDDRHAKDASLIRCIRSYQKEGTFPWVRSSNGAGTEINEHEFYGDLAREWTQETATKEWPRLLARVGRAEREIPRGWFRWLHHTPLSRLDESNRGPTVTDQLKFSTEWRALAYAASLDPARLDALLPNLETHAWEVGFYGLHRLAEACWARLTPQARGRLLAGIANLENVYDDEFVGQNRYASPETSPHTQSQRVSNWLLAHLPDADLDPESVLEIACCAVRNEEPNLLAEILRCGVARLGESIERMEPFTPQFWTRNIRDFDVVGNLSHRVIDMVLEAAILRGYHPGQRLALAAGASPNIRIWEIESSSNEQFTALSYAIDKNDRELIELLLASSFSGAHEGNGKALFMAIRRRLYPLADRMLDLGVPFEPGDVVERLSTSTPGSKIEWKKFPDLECENEDFDRAERLSQGLPLAHPSDVAWFIHLASMMGGSCSTHLSTFLRRDNLKRLRHFHSRGLPLRMTLPDFAIVLASGAYDCLCWMMQQWGTQKTHLLKIRREIPSFGTQGRLWTVRADAYRTGLLDSFDTADMEPLPLPDGGRLWMDLTGLAIQDMESGPAWTRKVSVDPRRRPGFVVLRSVSTSWESCPAPKNDYALRLMIPVIKEINGLFLHTGLTVGTLWGQSYPKRFQAQVTAWIEGRSWVAMRPRILERAVQNSAQRQLKSTAAVSCASFTAAVSCASLPQIGTHRFSFKTFLNQCYARLTFWLRK